MINDKLNDSNAVSLSMKNFGSMPDDLSKIWASQLPQQRKTNLLYPKKAIIEIANTCNLDCPMCRVGRYGINLNRVLEIDKFKNIINQLRKIEVIRLNGLGESTIVPSFDKYLEVLFFRKIVVELISNGTGDTDYYTSILDNNGVILFSCDSAEKEIFEILRRPAKWDNFFQNVSLTAKHAAKKGSTDRLFILFTLQKININQISKLVYKCSELNIKNIIINVIKSVDMDWIKKRENEIRDELAFASTLALNNNISLLIPATIGEVTLEFPNSHQTSAHYCNMPWEEIVIRWNGDIQACNMFNPYIYGNIFLNDFETIWNNAFANLFRSNINTSSKHPYCRDCVYIKDAYEFRKH